MQFTLAKSPSHLLSSSTRSSRKASGSNFVFSSTCMCPRSQMQGCQEQFAAGNSAASNNPKPQRQTQLVAHAAAQYLACATSVAVRSAPASAPSRSYGSRARCWAVRTGERLSRQHTNAHASHAPIKCIHTWRRRKEENNKEAQRHNKQAIARRTIVLLGRARARCVSLQGSTRCTAILRHPGTAG